MGELHARKGAVAPIVAENENPLSHSLSLFSEAPLKLALPTNVVAVCSVTFPNSVQWDESRMGFAGSNGLPYKSAMLTVPPHQPTSDANGGAVDWTDGVTAEG